MYVMTNKIKTVIYQCYTENADSNKAKHKTSSNVS